MVERKSACKQIAETQGHQRRATGPQSGHAALEPFERGYRSQRWATPSDGYCLVHGGLRSDRSGRMVGVPQSTLPLMEFRKMSSTSLLNLKGVVFKLHNRDEVMPSLRKDGDMSTALIFRRPMMWEIGTGSRDCSLVTSVASLIWQIKVEKGRAMFPATSVVSADETSKSIDALSLMHRSLPSSESATRSKALVVSSEPTLDKLVVEIETNGAITAKDASALSAKILVEAVGGICTAGRRRHTGVPWRRKPAKQRNVRSDLVASCR